MTYNEHIVVKPDVLAGFAAEALKEKVVVSNTVTKRSDHKRFFSAEGDTITQKVKGTLPVRNYALRNNRSQPLITDEYAQTKVKITLSMDRPYSATRLTPEQLEWDFEDGWGEILDAQTDTIVEKLESQTLHSILTAPYERQIKFDDSRAAQLAAREVDEDLYFNVIVDAKSALKKMRTPNDRLYALVGTALADKIVKSNKLRKDEGTGGSALTSDTLGVLAGVQLIISTSIPENEILMYAQSGFSLYTGVHDIPKSVPFGAKISAGGFALRHMLDYDTAYVTDRSVVDTLAGWAYTKDRLAVFNGESQHIASEEEFFLRGVRIGTQDSDLVAKTPGDGQADTPGGNPESWLAKAYKGEFIDTTKPVGKPFPLGGNSSYPVAKVQATAEATVAGGGVTAIAVTEDGNGYSSTPAVTISGDGEGATAVAVLTDHRVTDIIVTNAGTGYTAATVAIAAP